jgi:hypothetical protein
MPWPGCLDMLAVTKKRSHICIKAKSPTTIAGNKAVEAAGKDQPVLACELPGVIY